MPGLSGGTSQAGDVSVAIAFVLEGEDPIRTRRVVQAVGREGAAERAGGFESLERLGALTKSVDTQRRRLREGIAQEEEVVAVPQPEHRGRPDRRVLTRVLHE